jgi:hypothetical protein
MATADVAQPAQTAVDSQTEMAAVKTAVRDSVASASKQVKRQLSVKDMFSAATTTSTQTSSGASSSVTVKKARLSTTTAVGTSSTSLRPLQSLPFSLSAFQASLSESERALLRLECETMGKSWLKVLAPEIRKAYFLKLKHFLDTEGVRLGQDVSSCKVFPPRTLTIRDPEREKCGSSCLVCLFSSRRHLLVVPPHTPLSRTRRSHWPGPLPQRRPSPWALLLSAPRRRCPTLAPQHLRRDQERMARLRATQARVRRMRSHPVSRYH